MRYSFAVGDVPASASSMIADASRRVGPCPAALPVASTKQTNWSGKTGDGPHFFSRSIIIAPSGDIQTITFGAPDYKTPIKSTTFQFTPKALPKYQVVP
ncbi:MAG: hypothetical protein SFX73_01750 [Kofleriaceae bacterium]|nr:hypothetical protein [Kofleriaceae bacterium]